jgi:hypothetical protein
MNINFVYNSTNYNIDITYDTPLSYLYKVAEKTFNLPSDKILLFFGKKLISNSSKTAEDFFDDIKNITIKVKETNLMEKALTSKKPNKKTKLKIAHSKTFYVTEKSKNLEKNKTSKNDNDNNNNKKEVENDNNIKNNKTFNKNNSDIENNFESSESSHTIKKEKTFNIPSKINDNDVTGVILTSTNRKRNFITCQICNKKNAIFYCRNCNNFICFECNLRFYQHEGHELINLENGDILQSVEVYRKKILENLDIVENSYLYSSQFLIEDNLRVDNLNNLIAFIKEIDGQSKKLLDLKADYYVEEDLLKNFRENIHKIKPPRFKDETIEVFNDFNLKEIELKNYINFTNLQVIKSKFFKLMNELLYQVNFSFNKILNECNEKLKISEKVNDLGILELKSYYDEFIEPKETKYNYKNKLPMINKYYTNLTDTDTGTNSENNEINTFRSGHNKSFLQHLIQNENFKFKNNNNNFFKSENNRYFDKMNSLNSKQSLDKNNLKKLFNSDFSNQHKIRLGFKRTSELIDIKVMNQLLKPAKKKKKK